METEMPGSKQDTSATDLTRLLLEKMIMFDQKTLANVRMAGGAAGPVLRPGELKFDMEFTVPRVERLADRLKKDIDTYLLANGTNSDLVSAAQDSYEKAVDWTFQVARKMLEEGSKACEQETTEEPVKKQQPLAPTGTVLVAEMVERVKPDPFVTTSDPLTISQTA